MTGFITHNGHSRQGVSELVKILIKGIGQWRGNLINIVRKAPL